MRSRPSITVGIVAAVTSLLLAACGGSSSLAVRTEAATTASAKPLVIGASGAWGTTWSYNPFSSSFPIYLDGYALLSLAVATPPKLGSYIPEIADSWKATSGRVTIHVRPSARWQDGKHVTSRDVMTTLLLDGANGEGPWSQITGLSAPNNSTVILRLKAGASPSVVLQDTLGEQVVPAAQYARFVPPSLKRDLLAYNRLASTNATAASSSPEGKAISAVVTKVEGYQPKTFIGDGPFELAKMNTQEMFMTKSPTFWASKHIHVNRLAIEDFSSDSAIYPAMFAGLVSLTTTPVTGTILNKWRHTSDAYYVATSNYSQFVLLFNDRQYPFNLLRVRQALAYVINRKKATLLAMGGAPVYEWVRYPDGMLSSVQEAWLSKSQIHSMKTYSYDPAEATKILDGLGFHKGANGWITPKGKPFRIDLGGPAGWSDSMDQTLAVGNMLTNFGIKTTTTAVEQPGFWTLQAKGNFQMDWSFGADGSLSPLAGPTEVLLDLNYIGTGSSREDGIGFGPMETVPGLGSINIKSALTKESELVAPGQQTRKLAFDWARFINDQLPFLSLSDKNQQFEYSSDHYTDWPPASSSLWKLMGYDYDDAVAIAMEHGYIRPRAEP